MVKNIVVIVGSPRKNGNTEILADAFIKGAEENGKTVKKINLSELKINGCLACKYCGEHNGECCQNDDMQDIYTELYKADMVVFASPVYFYGLSAQIKLVIDRLYTMIGKKYPITASALLLVFGDTNIATAEPSILNYKTFTKYLKWENKGVIIAPNVNDKGDINGHASLNEAYEFGKTI